MLLKFSEILFIIYLKLTVLFRSSFLNVYENSFFVFPKILISYSQKCIHILLRNLPKVPKLCSYSFFVFHFDFR